MQDVLKSDKKFRYMMLDRLRGDCDYYLNYGNRNSDALWSNDEKEHIENMKKLHNSFDGNDKPEWLTWEQILDYERRMLKD
ncbi:LPD11 domain-containing protein [Paenibacillus sp. FSL L8-0436]|uniref:LPD11 domain-containing protein n=1 Tax=Paenibacillus sp. FSL L8-0436 TaxID=2954686 RepID=UPI0031592450